MARLKVRDIQVLRETSYLQTPVLPRGRTVKYIRYWVWVLTSRGWYIHPHVSYDAEKALKFSHKVKETGSIVPSRWQLQYPKEEAA
jgi:hypothetical protein